MTDDKISPEHDLQHFLRLAAAQVRYRISHASPGAPPSARLQLLEELIKEQIPNENSGSSARPAR